MSAMAAARAVRSAWNSRNLAASFPGIDKTNVTQNANNATVCSRHITNCWSTCALSIQRGMSGKSARDAT